jgi:hypothetical protein
MILRNEEECHGEGKAQRSGDHWGVEVVGSGADGRGRGPGDGRLEAHHLRLEGEVRRAGVNEAQRCGSWEDESQQLKKLVADLSLDKEMFESGGLKKRLGLVKLREEVRWLGEHCRRASIGFAGGRSCRQE